MPTKKPRNPDHVRRRNTPQPDNDAITKHLQDLLSPAIYAQSVLPKFGTQRADTQPNIDGRGGVNPNLASTVSTGVKPDVRATGIVVSSQSLTTSIVTKVSQFSSRAV